MTIQDNSITFGGVRYPSAAPHRHPTEREKTEMARQRFKEEEEIRRAAAARGQLPSSGIKPQSPHGFGPNLDPATRRELTIANGPVVPTLATKALGVSPSQPRYYSLGDNVGKREGTFRTRTEYVNFTGRTIYIQTPSNVTLAVTPTTNAVNPHEVRPCLEVRTTYEILTPQGIFETFEMLKAFITNRIPFDSDNGALWDALEKHYQNDSRIGGQTSFKTTYVQRTFDDEMTNQDRFLLRDSNCYISYNRESLAKPHPDSRLGMREPEKFAPEFQDHAGMMITVIDNHQLHRLRYYYAGKHIVAVPSQVDMSRENGVYVLTASSDAYGTVYKRTSHLSFEEAEQQLGLYPSRAEAETHGNPELLSKVAEARAKADLERQKHELEQQKVSLENLRHQLETKTIEKKNVQTDSQSDLEFWKMRNAQLKEQLDLQRALRDEELNERKTRRDDYYTERDLNRKDRFDKKSTKRKSVLEKIKFGQVALGAVAGLVALFAGKKLFGGFAAA